MFRSRAKRSGHRGAVRKTQRHFNFKLAARIGVLLSAVAIVTALAWQLHDYEPDTIMPIERVAIEGSFKNLAADEMQARVVEVLDGGYFTVDIEAIRQTLLQLPWVEDVSVRRQWPPALRIRVIEKQAVAYWGDDALMSHRGELFSPVPLSHSAPLLRLGGPDSLHEKVWQFATEVSQQMIALGMRTEKVELDDRRAWRVFVSLEANAQANEKSVLEISLGSSEVYQRLQRFLKVFAMPNAPSLSGVQVVDMRYPNGFALRASGADNRKV